MLYQPLLEYSTPYFVRKADRFTSFPMHMHHEIEILYCISGTLHAKLNGIKYRAKSGEALIIGSMTDHELVGDKDGCSILAIEFGPMLLREKFTFLSELKFDNPLLSFSESENSTSSGIRDCIYELIDIYDTKNTLSDLRTIGTLYNLSAAIVSTYGEKPVLPSGKTSKRQIEKALELIYLNYQSDLSVESAAAASGYSKSNFCRNFKLATGTSFHNYLAKYRIINSCYLLRSTDYSIGKISESVGYNDTRSFCRTFKQIMNMTPLQYRNAPQSI